MSIMDNTERNEEKVASSQQSKQPVADQEKATTEKDLEVAHTSKRVEDRGVATANDSEAIEYQKAVLKRNLNHIKLPFPWKVQEMLADVEKEGKSHIVAWLPHGKSFRVIKEAEFVSSIMPSYFNQSKFTSFTRQLYIYGFQKIQDGPDKGAFFHKQFIRSNKSLCLSMRRKKDKPLQKQPDPTSFLAARQLLTATASQSQMSINAPTPQQLLTGQRQMQPFTAQALANFLPSSNAALPSVSSTLPPMNPSLAAPQLNPSLQVSGFPAIPVPLQASNSVQDQRAEEEDWLAKYERLTARLSPPSNTNEHLHPNNVQSSLQDDSSSSRREVREQEDWLSIFEKTISNLSSSSDTFFLPTTSTTILNSLAVHRSPQAREQQIQEEKIHPRLSTQRSNSGVDPRRHYLTYRPSASEPSKEADTLSDGDEVDFEGMTFHFVERK